MENTHIYRILDVNFNRLKEGLRVVEEYFRFVSVNEDYLNNLKKIRHKITDLIKDNDIIYELIKARDIESDSIAYSYTENEAKRENVIDVLFCNFQRIKESLRVLEEYSKIIDKSFGEQFQEMRFEIYKLEKKVLKERGESIDSVNQR
jgi:thiamine-phosphate pyrophosphorylase